LVSSGSKSQVSDDIEAKKVELQEFEDETYALPCALKSDEITASHERYFRQDGCLSDSRVVEAVTTTAPRSGRFGPCKCS
jgi:hypothetical protein